MPKPTTVITDFVLEKLSHEPVQRRIIITRALAEVSANAQERANLQSLANLLEDVERNHQQLVLDFKKRHG